MAAYVIGAGGFKGKRTSSDSVPVIDPPNRNPDASVTQQTNYDQVKSNNRFFSSDLE